MKTLILFLLFSIIISCTNAQCWKMITAGGGGHTLAIKNDGTLWATGRNNAGQLGNNSINDEQVFVQIGTENDWQSVSATSDRSYAIKTNGTLWAWGLNFFSHLGLGGPAQAFKYLIPTKVGTNQDWLSLSVQFSNNSSSNTYVIKTDNTLWNLDYTPYQMGTASNWKINTVGQDHTLSIKTDGTLWGWGFNNYGQLGLGAIANVLDPTQIDNGTNWKAVSSGVNHSLAIKTDGTLWAAGGNESWQLGDGTQISKDIFTQIGTGTNWKTVAAGDYSSFATKTDGTLWAWGRNQSGELGLGGSINNFVTPHEPIPIDNGTNWQSVVTGSYTTFADKSDGSWWGWGSNIFGQIGDGTSVTKIVPALIPCNAVVPISLSSFSVQRTGNTALLAWKTDMELNSKEYQLEKSNDGIIFNWLTTIISNNNITGSNYTYTDPFPINGSNFYRIKSIDHDGRFSFSNTQKLNFEISTHLVTLFPNPVKNTLWVHTKFNGDKLSIVISDLVGKIVIRQSISNNITARVSTEGLKAGIYIVNISDGFSSETRKLIKE